MRFTSNGWEAWLARIVNDVQAPAHVSTLTWIAILICGVVFVAAL